MGRRANIQRVIFAASVLSAATILVWMGRALFAGTIPFTGDLLHFHYPLRQFYASALASGSSVAWMPAFYNGFYLAGEGQLGAYHPLHWVLYRALPLDAAFIVELVLAYPFAFGGMFLLLRTRCGAPSAAFGAMLFTFSGFMLSHGVHPNLVGIIAHLPWLLWAIHRTFAERTLRMRAACCGLLGLLTGSQLLLGHPQAVWLTLVAEAALAVSVELC